MPRLMSTGTLARTRSKDAAPECFVALGAGFWRWGVLATGRWTTGPIGAMAEWIISCGSLS